MKFEVYLLPETDFGKLVVAELANHLSDKRAQDYPSGRQINGQWDIVIPVPDSETEVQEVTVARDRKGLRLVATELELLPALPDVGIDFVAISDTVAEDSVNGLAPSAGYCSEFTGYKPRPAHAWKVTPALLGTLPVLEVEVRTRTRDRSACVTAAVEVFDEVMQGGIPGTSSGSGTKWRLDPWTPADLSAGRY